MDTEKKTKITLKTAIILALAVLLLAFGVILLIGLPRGWFGGDPSENDGQGGKAGIEDIKVFTPDGELFMTVDGDDPLGSVPKVTDYTCTVTVSDSYDAVSSAKYDVTAYKGRFRIDGEGRTVIYDGKTYYSESQSYIIRKETTDMTFESEVGICSFDELIARGAREARGLDRDMAFVITFENGDLREEYTVSLVYGIVVSGTVYSGDTLVKSFSVTDINILTDENIDLGRLTIPE